jgi:para-nitrobenzyl esterase
LPVPQRLYAGLRWGEARRDGLAAWRRLGPFRQLRAGTDGTHLARAQDVVAVTVNRRLNAFGFLRMEDADERFADSGNSRLLDIVDALEWVRDNCAAFGGDPDNVTIFGQSGGGTKIEALLAIPRAKGLFHKAIIQSGSGGIRIAGPDEAERMAAELARALGLSRLDADALQ